MTDSAPVTSSDSRVFNLSVPGTAAIYLAGRDDVTIPLVDADDVAFSLLHCGGDLQETFPLLVSVKPGERATFEW